MVIAAFLAGSWTGSRGGSVTGEPLQPQVQKLQAQIDMAKKNLPPLPQQLNTVSGTIKSISGNTISLEASIFSPFEELPPIRTITVTDKTTVIKLEQKAAATYQKELAEYQKASEPPKGSKTPPVILPIPNPYTQLPGSRADLKPGLSISVTAKEDVKTKEAFEAAGIEVL